MTVSPNVRTAVLLSLVVLVPHGWANERRAPAPKHSDKELDAIFFDDLSKAFKGKRPTLSAIRQSNAASMAVTSKSATQGAAAPSGSGNWAPLISPSSIEDEVKRLKLHFDTVVTTPGAFNSGGYMEARLDLTILAMMFAVITEHGGDVRWKKQAEVARDLFARTAFNCKAGSTQVYNEAKLRKADLQDLLSGSGLSSRGAEEENDWSMIVDRSPLMEYAEWLIDSIEDSSRNAASVKSDLEKILREAELISILGEVLTKEGVDGSDDDDYVKFSRDMIAASKAVVVSLNRGDPEEIRKGVSAIRQRCNACHNEMR